MKKLKQKIKTNHRNIEKLIVLYKESVDDDNFDVRYKNSIVFKGALGKYMPYLEENKELLKYSDEGHYVFVNKKMQVFGTYEDNILMHPADDGICHGYALLCAFMENDPQRTKFPEFNPDNITRYPLNTSLHQKDISSIAMNYFIILNFYLFIIDKGWWLNAVNIYFPPEKEKKQPKNIHQKEIEKIERAIKQQLIIIEPYITQNNSKYNLSNNQLSQKPKLFLHMTPSIQERMNIMEKRMKVMADQILTLKLINLKKERVNREAKSKKSLNKPNNNRSRRTRR